MWNKELTEGLKSRYRLYMNMFGRFPDEYEEYEADWLEEKDYITLIDEALRQKKEIVDILEIYE